MRPTLIALAALACSGPSWAECTNSWTRASAETMAVSDGTEFRITRFANMETKLALVEAGRTVEVLFTRSGYLVKGVAEAELQKFAAEAHWLMVFSEPAASVVWKAVKVAPCTASGRYEIDIDPGPNGGNHRPELKLLRARGQAVADGQGLIRYSIRFDTEPALPPDRALTYVGTMSFVKAGDAMPGETLVGGFSVLSRDLPPFVAAPGTMLSQLPVVARQ